MALSKILKDFPVEDSLSARPRPYFNHSIELKGTFTREERMRAIEKAGLNVFFFPAEMITGCDFLSDSGTTTMTNRQWAALHMGDEAYGSNRGYFLLMEQIRETFGSAFFNDPGSGSPNAFLFHQGRPSEDAIFSMVGKTGSGLIIPNNGHFDTTAANIENNGIKALNLFCSELKDPDCDSKFKGNMDVGRFTELIRTSKNKIPMAYLTITNNTGGGQPVSMGNIREVSTISRRSGIPLFFDACRFAENAWFIREHEKGYSNKKIADIVREMFSYCDGFTMSFKKDGLVNMGGGLFLRDRGLFMRKYPKIPYQLMDHQIIKEGHPTYGGMSGRDIMALVEGLKTITKEKYLEYRVRQVREFGEGMKRAGIPVLMPTGGHAVYIDVNQFFEGTRMKGEDFGGIALTALLLGGYGHRACELGYFVFGSYNQNTKKETHPEVNFVRFAVPRLRYERQDLEYVVECMKVLHEGRDKIPGVKVTYGRELPLRHFKARFAFKK